MRIIANDVSLSTATAGSNPALSAPIETRPAVTFPVPAGLLSLLANRLSHHCFGRHSWSKRKDSCEWVFIRGWLFASFVHLKLTTKETKWTKGLKAKINRSPHNHSLHSRNSLACLIPCAAKEVTSNARSLAFVRSEKQAD